VISVLWIFCVKIALDQNLIELKYMRQNPVTNFL